MEDYHKKDHSKIELKVEDKIIEASCYVSLKDIKTFEENKELKSSEIVMKIIKNHVNEECVDEIANLSDDEMGKFISSYVESTDGLKAHYVDIQSSNSSDRLVAAFRLYVNDLNQKMKETMKPIMESLKQINVPQVVIPHIEVPKIAIPPEVFKISESISQITRSVQEVYKSSVFETIREVSQAIVSSIPDYSAMFAGLGSALAELAKNISVPSLSDEQKSALQDSYKVWGEYGWTVPPYARINVFNHKPEALKDANDYMRQYINKASMQELFSDLRELKNIRKDDLEEAIANFEDGRYKSCAMVLFALIDGKIIRNQDRDDNRSVGLRGVRKIYDKMETELVEQNAFFSLLNLINVNSALQVIFAKGNNFKEQPDIMNRNFIDHGMLHNRVRRRDAAQLFLLLYNLTGLVDGWEGMF